jgi:flagellar basal body-associated protein FliL
MPNASRAEIYFIAAMMILIFVISTVAVYFFFITYKKEKAERIKRIEKQKAKSENIEN